MGGTDAARGFEYQFLCTLEYALLGMAEPGSDLTAVRVEGPASRAPGSDAEIVDFALTAGDRNLVVAQVKSGRAGSSLQASDVVAMLLRLLTHDADKYVVITNRGVTPSLTALLDLLNMDNVRAGMLALLERSPSVHGEVLQRDDAFWERLRHTDIVVDRRSVEDVRTAVRERVREARHRTVPAAVGWDAAGLLTGYLIAEVLAKAALPDSPALTVTDLLAVLGLDQQSIKALMVERDWAVPVTPAPRGSDIARPALLAKIADALPTPVRGDTASICVLTGLSGIGKTSLAAAWADDRADAYAAVFWINATGAAHIEASFAAVAEWFQHKGVIPQTGAPLRDRVFTALARTARPWLMVFDNCPELDHVRAWIPPRGHGQIIVTTIDQNHLGGASVATVDVTKMTDMEAVHLLAQRLAPRGPLTADHHEMLRGLAERLHNWPLALELAAAYITSCLGGLDGVEAYERLMMRSLDDEPSVPLGYPQTLVKAIALTFRRITQRTGAADRLAAMSLRCAAFVASRQIPLHLLLVCWSIDRAAIAGVDAGKRGLFYYSGDDPPVEEIARALRRDSLVSTDEPLLTNADAPMSAASVGSTVSMNDIVQTVLRIEVDREGTAEASISTIAFHTQYWLSFFHQNRQMRHACTVLGHAIAVADHALARHLADQGIALLWGNAAAVLAYLDHWRGSIRYLTAELSFLDQHPRPDVVMRMQTLITLADALYRGADRPCDNESAIIGLLERVLADVPAARELAEDITANGVRVASATVAHLLANGGRDSRLAGLRAVFNDLIAMLPVHEGIDWLREVNRMTTLLHEGQHAEVRATAERLLAQFTPACVEYPQLLRFIAEASVYDRDWEPAHKVAKLFLDAVTTGSLSRFDTAMFLRNVGGACLVPLLDQDDDAVRLFETSCQIADLADQHGIVVQAGDRDVIAVHRALRACLYHDADTCRKWLDRASLADIAEVEPVGMSRMLYRLLRNWTTCIADSAPPRSTYEPPADHVDHVAAEPSSAWAAAVAHALADGLFWGAINQATSERAPAVALAMAHGHRASGRPVRHPMEVAVELCLAFHVLGLPARIALTELQVRPHDRPDVTLDPTWFTPADEDNMHAIKRPHYVVWAQNHYLVDATIPHLRAFRHQADMDDSQRRAVISEPFGPDCIQVVLRRPFLLWYQAFASYDGNTVAVSLPPDRRRVCEVNAFLVALQATFALSMPVLGKPAELRSLYPHLADILMNSEHLSRRFEAT